MLKKKSINYNCLSFLLCMVLISTPILNTLSDAVAQVQDACEKEIQEAEQKYRIGRFDDAIELLTQCLEKPTLSKGEKLKAYRLLGLAYIGKDYLNDARQAIRKLLDIVPDYEPDPIQDPPPFTKLVVEEKQKQTQIEPPEDLSKLIPLEKKGISKWLIIGGAGVLAGGVTAVLMLSGGGNGETGFPFPPGRPSGN